MDNKRKSRSLLVLLAPVIVFFVFFGGIELFVNLMGIRKWVFPAPSSMFIALGVNFLEYAPHLLITLEEIIIGFMIGAPIGILLGAVISQFKALDRALSPYVILIVMTPLITLVPMLLTWFGPGLIIKIIAAAIQTFPIVLMNSATGFSSVPQIKLELMKSMGAGRIESFLKVTLPFALPDVFTGLKLGAIFATIAAVTAEMVGGTSGLGNLIGTYTGYIQLSKAFAAVLLVASIGFTLYNVLSLLEDKVVSWGSKGAV